MKLLKYIEVLSKPNKKAETFLTSCFSADYVVKRTRF